MTPNEQTRYRANTEKVAAMYGHRFLCRKCGQSCAPAGRKKANGEGWICAGCAERAAEKMKP